MDQGLKNMLCDLCGMSVVGVKWCNEIICKLNIQQSSPNVLRSGVEIRDAVGPQPDNFLP